MKQPIELRRLRDFGQIINDSFTFLKENFKPLFRELFVICGFFIILGTITQVFALLKTPTLQSSDSYEASSNLIRYFLTTLLNVFVLILTHVFINVVTICYISVYVQKGNKAPDFVEVWGYFKFYFLRVLGSGILIFFLFVIGYLCCIIPGIYLTPILYLIIPIIIIENTSFGFAFNKSFRLIRDNWWLVFGVIFVMDLIVGIAGSFVNIPISLITTGSKFFSVKGFTTLPLVIFLSIMRNVLNLAYVIPAIATCLCYFTLDEEKEGTGILGRIERLGKVDNLDAAPPTEEY